MIPLKENNRGGKAKELFHISTESGYSGYWRRDKSPVEILELTKLLQGIRKFVLHVGRNTGTVEWEGMSQASGGIILDPSLVVGTYPVPASKADIATGVAVREAYHQTEWSEHVRKTALARFSFPPAHAYKFKIFLDMSERVYVDALSNGSVFGLYTGRARKWAIDKAKKQFLPAPTVTELLHVWWNIAAARERRAYQQDSKDGYVSQFVDGAVSNDYYKKPLAILDKNSDRLIAECHLRGSVTDRCDFRVNLYGSIFNELVDHVKNWPGDRKDPYIVSEGIREDDIKIKDEEGNKEASVTIVRYMDEVTNNIRGKRKNFTNSVKSIVANFNDVVPVQGNDFVMPSEHCVDKAILYKIKVALLSVSQRRTSNNRGLVSGKVDHTRLFRAQTTGRIFSQKKIHFELYNDIIFLIDCTGSMADPDRWEKLVVIYQTLFMAFLAYNSNAKIFAYNERGDTCRITEIYKDGKFYRITPQGKTASGEAIIATALSIRKSRRNPFIIHITDGACNWGCGVKDSIRYCKEKKIRLITLGLDCDPANQDALRKEYGELLRFFKDVDDLPRVLKNVLRTPAQSDPRFHSDLATGACRA